MPRISIDLNKPMLDVQSEGLKATNEKLSTVLASLLQKSATGDVIKHWEWMNDLCKGGILDLDTADHDYLMKFIKDHQQAWAGPRGQLLFELKRQKDEAEKPKADAAAAVANN